MTWSWNADENSHLKNSHDIGKNCNNFSIELYFQTDFRNNEKATWIKIQNLNRNGPKRKRKKKGRRNVLIELRKEIEGKGQNYIRNKYQIMPKRQ